MGMGALGSLYTVVANTTQAQAQFTKLAASHRGAMMVMQSSSRAAEIALIGLAAGAVAVGAGAMIALATTTEFNSQLTTLRALSGITKEEMYELSKSVNAVSSEFGVSGNEIAAGTVTLSKAGLTVEEINQSIRAMTMLSRANGMAFDEAATMSVFAIETFGKSFDEVGDVLDKMQVAAKESILDVADLQSGFAYAGSTANMMGVSFEQLISVMAVLSNRALEAGISARSFNKMLLDMFVHTEEVDEMIKSLGYDFNILGEDGVMNLDQLMEALSNTTLTTELLKSGLDVFTVRALRAFGVLAGAAGDYETMLNKVLGASGTLEEVAAVQMEGWTFQFAKLREEFMAVLRAPEVMETIATMVEQMVKVMSALRPELLRYIISSVREFTELITSEYIVNGLTWLAGMVGHLSNVFGTLLGHLGKANGLIIKVAIGIKFAAIFFTKFLAILNFTSHTMQITNMQLMSGIDLWLEQQFAITTTTSALYGWNTATLTAAESAEIMNAAWNALKLTIQQIGMALLGVYTAGMMWGTSSSIMMKAVAGLTAVLMSLNLALMITTAMAEAVKASIMAPIPGVGIAVFVASMALFIGVAASYSKSMKASRAEMESYSAGSITSVQSGYAEYKGTADTGMFGANPVGTYDTGGARGPRHKLAYVEPGEQIISKTQGMAGMGGGITVNVGDVYAQDGTDFAEKLAEALPRALRQSSYAGGF